MAEVLGRSGYDIKHEKPGADGCVSWPMVVNSYSPWGPMSNDDFEHVFHQVRNPLNVINSWIVNISNLKRDEWQFIRRHVPEIKEDDSVIVSAVKYWVYWNKMADAISEWRYRIEDFKEVLPEFMQRAEIEIDINEFDKIATNFNTWKEITTKLTWDQLKEELPDDLYSLLENLANEYGYAITDGYGFVKAEGTKDIHIEIDLNCPVSQELDNYINSVGTTEMNWETSFIRSMNELIKLVESNRFNEAIWSSNVTDVE